METQDPQPLPPRASLPGLPRELRLVIYSYLYEEKFIARQICTDFSGQGKAQFLDPPSKHRQPLLHSANKQLRAECLPYYIRCNSWIFDLGLLDPETGTSTILSCARALGDGVSTVHDLIVEFRGEGLAEPLFSIYFFNHPGSITIRGYPTNGRKLGVCLGLPECGICNISHITSVKCDEYCNYKLFDAYAPVMRELQSRIQSIASKLKENGGVLVQTILKISRSSAPNSTSYLSSRDELQLGGGMVIEH